MHFGISSCPPIHVNQCQSSSSACIYTAIPLFAGLFEHSLVSWLNSSLLPSCLWKILDQLLKSPVGTLAESRMLDGQSIVQQYYHITTPPLLWAGHSTLFVLHSPWFSSPRRRTTSPTVSMAPTSLFRGWFSIKLWIYMYSLFHQFHAWPLAISNLLITLVNSWLFSMSSTL